MAEFHIIYFGLAFLTTFNILLAIISLHLFLKNKQANNTLQEERDLLVKRQQELGFLN